MIYHDGTRFVATLTDKQGNPIGGAAIEITINGRSYDKITDEKGSVSLGLNLNSGIYSVVVKFKGLLNYTPITKHANVTIEQLLKDWMLLKCLETAHNIMQYLLILRAISLKTKIFNSILTVYFTQEPPMIKE